MNIFFSGSIKVESKFQNLYGEIIEYIEKKGDSVISLNNGKYSDLLKKDYIKTHKNNEIHYAWIQKAILTSDCTIIESSKDGFTLGHIATLSLLYNKPVLCLSVLKDYSEIILNRKFYAYQYKETEDLFERIELFIEEVKAKHLSIRKNIYISPDNANFLDWLGRHGDESASEVIRNLINKYKKNFPDYPEKDSHNTSRSI